MSHSAVQRVHAYIERQAEHHRALSSRREIELLLRKHGISAFDQHDLGA